MTDGYKDMSAAGVDNMVSPSRTDAWRMFDRIAHRYDLLNRLLSFRQDVAWRKLLVKLLPDRPSLHILDLATGTGDVLLSLCRGRKTIERAVGIDMAGKMLAIGKDKIAAEGLSGKATMVRGDATRLGVEDAMFDAVTIAFGIRNVIDVDAGLREMHRILKPGGRALVLEFSLPGNALFRALYLFYFRNVLPRVGGLISGDHAAYRYLNTTVETFPYGEAFCAMMRSAGFRDVKAHPLTMGIATVYQGDK